jgi:hypothetical protein
MGFPRHALSPAELAALLEAERRGVPFLAYRDGAGDLRIESLGGHTRVVIGRSAENDIELGWAVTGQWSTTGCRATARS